MAKSTGPVKIKSGKVLTNEETQLQNKIFKISPEMYKINFQRWAIFQRRPFSVNPYINAKQGRKRPLDTPKRMVERRER